MNFQKPFISTEPTLSTKKTQGTATTATLRDATGVNVPTDPAGFPLTGVIFGPAVCPICVPDTNQPTSLTPTTIPTTPIFPSPTYPAPTYPMPPILPGSTNPMLPGLTYPAPTYPGPTTYPAPTYPMPTNPMLPGSTNPMLPIDPTKPILPPIAPPTAPIAPFLPTNPVFPAFIQIPFPPTPQVFLEEFYNQLRFLNYFFMKHEKKYWITGGTLLGQVREKKIINWDTNNDVGVLVANEAEGESLFQAIRSFIAMTNMGKQFDIWRSTHGLKLISKQLAHAGTDIYFYHKSSDKAVLLRERSQKQWPNDYFQLSEIEKEIMQVPFGPIAVCVPNDPTRYLKTLYGANVFTHARLGSFDHFTNGPRIGPKTEFPLYQ